jgi:hypothetical protein
VLRGWCSGRFFAVPPRARPALAACTNVGMSESALQRGHPTGCLIFCGASCPAAPTDRWVSLLRV